MTKFTAKNVFEQIDFADAPRYMFKAHGLAQPYWYDGSLGEFDNCEYSKDPRSIRFLESIAESLSLDGTVVKGLFTVAEKTRLAKWAADRFEEELFGVKR